MELGKKIKQLRTAKGVTQDKLADYLNVSFQAVSKWEQGTTSPDIALLPKLSTFFGITIDDLFTLSSDAHLERIENMLSTESTLSSDDESYARNYLKGLIDNVEKKGKAFTLLSSLCNHRAVSYHQQASEYAMKALTLEPQLKDNHVELVEASRGHFTDWNYHNHRNLISYYREFCDKNPEYTRGFMYLLDHLIVDGRLVEAEETLKKMRKVDTTFRSEWYEGQIANKSGHREKAFKIFDSMVASDTENWLVWATRADEYARVNRYDEAIIDYKKSHDLQPKPRYIDAYQCMAHIYEIQGKYDEAILMWKDSIKLLRDDWSITFGKQVDKPQGEIKRLSQLMGL